MKIRSKTWLLVGASLCFSQQAAAQAAADQPEKDNSQLGEIVVTAQKRSENMQRVPITITAITGDDLGSAGVAATRDLATVVPGLVFNQSLGSGTPFLRGVGQTSGSAGIEPSVSFYVDGVYIPAAGGTLLSLSNVSQVAVLKGPQGTLFGRNSTGGVIQVTTTDPTDQPAFNFDVGYANYRTVEAHAYASTPLSDNVKTGFSVSFLNQDKGWGRNLSLNKDVFTRDDLAVQNKTIFSLGDTTDLTSNLVYTRRVGYVGPTLSVPEGSLALDGISRYVGEYNTAVGLDTKDVTRQFVGSLTLNHDFGWSRLTAIGSIQDYNEKFAFDLQGVPFGLNKASVFDEVIGTKTYTGELQLQSPNNQDLNWIFGLYYFNSTTTLDNGNRTDGTPTGSQHAEGATESVAAFAQVSKNILPDTRLTVGARYTIDKKSVTGAQYSTAGVVTKTFDQIALAGGFPTEVTWKKPTFRVSLDHQMGDTMLFASYNRGFKGGLYNLQSFARPANPESLDAFEVGAKTDLLDHHLRINLSGFLYNYTDLQLRTVVGGSTTFIIYNAGKAKVKGVDLDFTAKIAPGFELTGGFEYTDGKYTSFPGASCSVPKAAGGILTGGNSTVVCDLSGSRMARTPDFAGNIGFRYMVPLSNGGDITFAANDGYNSGFIWDPDGRLKQDAYHSISASVKWTLPNERAYVKLWGSNLANEVIRSQMSAGGSDIFTPGDPRTYGITFGMKLGS